MVGASAKYHVLRLTMRFLFRLVVFVLVVVLIGAVAGWYLSSRGYSARAEPTRLEEAIALRLRSLATPRDAKAASNPLPATAEHIRAGLEHFADHCAICHDNDGTGDGPIGQGLYPKPPDLRAARTQSLTDGELFYIIENGVRFTGMPAFGGEHGSRDESWQLVRFIRHLRDLTPEELERMRTLNPKSPAERAPEQPGPGETAKPAPHSHRHREGGK
jgi:mono/diheme cytochrome c family protein